MASRPANQAGKGGISHWASSRSSRSKAAMSASWKAFMYRSNRARWSAPAGSTTRSSAGAASSSRARARCNALLTAAVVVPSSSATSAARQASTSRRISTTRCRAGRCCNAAMSASRMPARDATTAAGSPDAAASSASGMGWSHATSGRPGVGGMPGSSLGPPSPDGKGRRLVCSSAVRHRLVAIRYSQARSDDRPSNPS